VVAVVGGLVRSDEVGDEVDEGGLGVERVFAEGTEGRVDHPLTVYGMIEWSGG